jgi:hypothetical protein
MKRPLLVLLTAATAPADTLQLGSAAGEPASSVLLPLTLQKDNPVVAVQCDLSYAGEQLTAQPVNVTAPGTDHTAASADTAAGVTRIVVWSPTNAELPASLTISIPLDLADASPSGGPSLELQNIIFTDAAGSQIPAAAAYTLAEQWRREHFTPAERALADLIGDDRDADGDSLLNLLELAAGTDPRAPDPAKVPVPAVGTGAPRTLSLTFHRGKSAAAQNAVSVTPESSADLTTWSPDGIAVALTGTQDADSVEMKASITAAGEDQRFLRLRIRRTE